MMNKFFDLRFVIGAFFSIIGILLLLYGFFADKNESQDLNQWCGGIFIVFGIIMIALSYQKNKQEDTSQ